MLNAIEVILICLVAQAALTDLAMRKIPNVLILSGLMLALILHLLSGQPGASVSLWLAGGCAGFFLFLPLYLACGGISVRNRFERAADRYAQTGRGWWPWPG